jgi:hypothetical protein
MDEASPLSKSRHQQHQQQQQQPPRREDQEKDMKKASKTSKKIRCKYCGEELNSLLQDVLHVLIRHSHQLGSEVKSNYIQQCQAFSQDYGKVRKEHKSQPCKKSSLTKDKKCHCVCCSGGFHRFCKKVKQLSAREILYLQNPGRTFRIQQKKKANKSQLVEEVVTPQASIASTAVSAASAAAASSAAASSAAASTAANATEAAAIAASMTCEQKEEMATIICNYSNVTITMVDSHHQKQQLGSFIRKRAIKCNQCNKFKK